MSPPPSSRNSSGRGADPLGLSQARRDFGEPVEKEVYGHLPSEPDGSRVFGRRRRAEIVMVLPRPDGVLLHTKAFYPGGVFRLPTGGLKARENLAQAARREVMEETGLSLEPSRFLFHLIQQIDHADGRRPFHSFGILYPRSEAPVIPQDPNERITMMTGRPWDQLAEVAAKLESLTTPWRAWGIFRALPHRLLIEVRRARPEWFGPGPSGPAADL